MLDEHETASSAVRNTAIDSVRLLPFGKSRTIKQDTEAIQSTLDQLTSERDFCLVDGGVMKSAFTEKLIANADATVLYVEIEKTTEAELKAAAQRVRDLGGNLIGCVVGGIYKSST